MYRTVRDTDTDENTNDTLYYVNGIIASLDLNFKVSSVQRLEAQINNKTEQITSCYV